MNKNYAIKHWLTTLLLAPFLPSVYELIFKPISGQVVGLLEVYPITLVFSFWKLIWVATSPQLQNIGGVYLEDAEIAKFDAENYDSIAAAYSNSAGFGGVAPLH